jgi:endonuclease/exonuclease/phosphatase family metal-dependent hydrolase
MARKVIPARAIRDLLAAFLALPFKLRLLIAGVGLVAVAIFLIVHWSRSRAAPSAPSSAPTSLGAKTVVLCTWNLENLFDDRDDRRRFPDEEFDDWFVKDPAARLTKYERMSEALVRLNGGHGPDIIAANEVESVRALELLRERLNSRLPAEAAQYDYLAMVELDAGRHIAPGLISRYPTSGAKLRGRHQRILEAKVTVNGHDLTIIASHWTSQITDRGEDDSRGRFAYANTIHAAFAEAIRANPIVDFLVCGDFNDAPEARSVTQNLNVTGEAALVTPDASPPRLFGVLSGKPASRFGTYYYERPQIYDQIAVSPGLLDVVGWSYVPDSVQVPTDGLTRGGSLTRRPWRFGTRRDEAVGRGYSDHFPVLVTLRVAE